KEKPLPTIVSHAAVAVAAGVAFAPRDVPNHFWALAILCSILPDADVIGFFFGIPYRHVFGHRGFFHSLLFGLLFGALVACISFRETGIFTGRWFFFLIFFALLTASHGLLDALTNGGLGIALLSPFDNTRHFFPWTPIEVSPIGIGAFFSKWGLAVIKSELLWVWLPSFAAVVLSTVIRGLDLRH
ncbi:MAG: metal-dependent hydrolase, partial [Deltaproteobacteria bacterium]|nr:metal-dependent hydrolase [Deltaproteobacteria bacterium]